ncbi:MAG: hypothetical protein RLZZ543_232 [Bacteroidota bacterium]|jgi:phosphatidylinositol glycan class B
MREILQSTYRNVFLLGLLVFLLTAYFSIGYFHPDEHFQIFEFCNYKLGRSPLSDLPWEYNEHMRPTLQPAMVYAFIQVFGVDDPFRVALVFRLLSAVLCWYITARISLLLLPQFKSDKGKTYFIAANYFLWFIPLISVRFSSENFSAIALLMGLYALIKEEIDGKEAARSALLWSGFLFGLSFFFRFQMGFAFVGLAGWLLFIRKMNVQRILFLVMGGMGALLLGTLCDRWFYGDWYCSPYQYFFANIIQQKAAGFGIEPWWYYFSSFIQLAIPPISVMLLVLLLLGAFKQKRNVFLWLLVPFVLAHSAVGHKELRFLFPMIFALIYFAALGLDAWIVSGKALLVQRIVLFICLLLNVPLLIGRSFIPAQETIAYHRYLYYQYKEPITLLGREKDLYYIAELNANFYRSKQITSKAMENDSAIVAYLTEQHPERILLFEQELKNGAIQYQGYKRQRVYCLFPDWLLSLNFNNWQQRSRIWSVWELKAIPES